MLALITASLKPTSKLVRNPLLPHLITFDLSMTNQHICPCCSYVLLRHMRLGGLYWRCSHCYVSMPAWSFL